MNEATITLTLDQLRDLICKSDTTTKKAQSDPSPTKGDYVIVRGINSGVFAGNLVSISGENNQLVELTQARHIWYWSGAANVAEMATRGVSRPSECKFVGPVGRIQILDGAQVTYCTPEAEMSLRAVPAWTEA